MIDSYASIIKIRRQVFEEVAKMAYASDFSTIEEIPYKMLNGEAKYRESIFLERAIVAERLRLAIGLPVRSADEHSPIGKGVEEAARSTKFYEPPLVNVIDFACNSCPTESYFITNACEGCLANPCINVCPKHAISKVNGKSVIDQSLCIKCGRCKDICPYQAIIHRQRPCQKACGMKAIESDERGKAKINYEKCVSCGMCIVSCPFGAIADKSQIAQVIMAINEGCEVIAIMAPSFVGQFGPKVNLKTMDDAVKKLGFIGAYEVSVGADLCTIEEANDFLREVPEKMRFMGTSCCPSWSVMAKKEFPDYKDNISMSLTPMVFTARMLKKDHPNCKIVFVGPCSAKKLEASRKAVRSDVDFVLTFEELMGMFVAKNVDFNTLTASDEQSISTATGRGFAVAGGVASAVVEACKVIAPDREVKIANATGLANCKQLLKDAIAGKYDGYLLEGMACQFGCASGPGTISTPNKTKALVEAAKKDAKVKNSVDSVLKHRVTELEE